MKKKIYFSLSFVLSIFFVGSGIYFFNKSSKRRVIKPKENVVLTSEPLQIIVVKELFNDFESEESQKRYLTTVQKHFSGKRSVKIDSKTEYSGEVVQSFSEIPRLANLREVEVSLKYWNEKINEGVIWVLEVDGQNGSVLSWQGDMMPDTLNKWGNYSARFRIKAEYLRNFNRIKTYAWNKNHSTFYIDDLHVKFLGIPQLYNNSEIIKSDNKQTTFHFDLENDTAIKNTGTLTTELSLSGKHSSMLNGRDKTSIMVCKKIEDVTSDTLRNVTASVWIYPLTDNPNCVLTLEIRSNDDEQLYWNGKGTDKMHLKARQWQKVNALFNFDTEDNSKLNADDQVCIYLWNKSDTKIYADDFDISYGSAPPKKGVQTYVDMNATENGTYIYSKYHPPYAQSILSLKNISNDDSPYLVHSGSLRQGYLDPYQILCAGNFSGNKNTHDELLAVTTRELSLFHFCESKGRFVVDGITSFEKNIFPYDTILSGDYNGDGKDEILLLSPSSAAMYGISFTSVSSCADNLNGISLREIWKGEVDTKNTRMFSGNFSGDKAKELLLAGRNGRLRLLKFTGTGWETLLEDTVGSNVFSDTSTSVSLKYSSSTYDELLSIYSKKNSMKGLIMSFNGNKLIKKTVNDESSLFNVFALDDQLFAIRLKNKNTDDILSFNSRWRNELKHISYDKSGFYVASVPEFTGFEADQNPKYYEIIRLVPGAFTEKETSLMCVLRNCADPDFNGSFCRSYDSIPSLPGRIQLYSFSK